MVIIMAHQSNNKSETQSDQAQTTSEGSHPWHRPPMITPNFGKRKKLGLKSNITQVLLHDNINEEHMLNAQLNNIKIERHRSTRLLDLHKKSFLVQMSVKQQQLRASGINHLSILPDDIANAHGGMSKYRDTDGKGTKDVTFAIPAENNNIIEIGSPRSTKTGSALSRSDASVVSQSSLPDIKKASQANRSRSAIEVTDKTNFMTHDYRIRREKTAGVPASCARRDRLDQTKHKKKSLRALKDPRYISLEKTLVHCGKPVDGYLQLSASGQYVLQRYGKPNVDQEYLHRLVQEMTMIRQSRLNSRCSGHMGHSRRASKVSDIGSQQIDRLIIKHGDSKYSDSSDGHY